MRLISISVLSLFSLFTSLIADTSNFKFSGPQIIELSDKTRELVPTDLDSDGRMDLIVVNNKDMKIECLYQRNSEELSKAAKEKLNDEYWKPIYNDMPFLNEEVLIGDYIYALKTVDFDDDGLMDFVYCGKSDFLTVLFQNEKGKWEDEWSYDQKRPLAYGGTLACEDLNNDGQKDIIALVKNAILIFKSDGSRIAPKPKSYAVFVDDAQELKAIDINLDSKLDLVYFSKSHQWPMRVRLQKEDGEFGPEVAVPLKISSTDWEAMSLNEQQLSIATIHKNKGEVEFNQIIEKEVKNERKQRLQANMYHVPHAGKLPMVYCMGDFNGDQYQDVVAADPNEASIYLYPGHQEKGFLSPKKFPSYSKISSLAKVREKGQDRDSLVVCSSEESIVGLATYQKNRFSFPKALTVEAEPVLAASIDLDGDQLHEIAIVTRDGRRYNIEVLHLQDEDKNTQVKLGSLSREPTYFISQDLNADQKLDLMIMLARDPIRVFLQTEDGELEEFEDESGLISGQFKDLEPSNFSLGDYNADGKDEWILTKKGYARAYQINGDKLELIDQANARQSDDEVLGAILYDIDDDGDMNLLIYDYDNLSLQVFSRTESGVYEYQYLAEVGKLDLQYSFIQADATNKTCMMFGRHSFWHIPLQNKIMTNHLVDKLSTKLDEAHYNELAIGDLNSDNSPDIAIVDGTQNFLELFYRDEENSSWNSALRFKVFQKDIHGSNRQSNVRMEPRELIIEDFSNDGKDDIVMLCHNRVLLYTQK